MKDQPKPKTHKANYGDATPGQVARALLLYRPKRKRTQSKPTQPDDRDAESVATEP